MMLLALAVSWCTTSAAMAQEPCDCPDDEPVLEYCILDIEGSDLISVESTACELFCEGIFAYSDGADGLLTRKVSFELEVDLYKEADPAPVRHLIINDGVLAFALPDEGILTPGPSGRCTPCFCLRRAPFP